MNLMIFTNITIIIGIVYTFTTKSYGGSDDIFYKLIQPILRLMIITTFLIAGFHKLNFDS